MLNKIQVQSFFLPIDIYLNGSYYSTVQTIALQSTQYCLVPIQKIQYVVDVNRYVTIHNVSQFIGRKIETYFIIYWSVFKGIFRSKRPLKIKLVK